EDSQWSHGHTVAQPCASIAILVRQSDPARSCLPSRANQPVPQTAANRLASRTGLPEAAHDGRTAGSAGVAERSGSAGASDGAVSATDGDGAISANMGERTGSSELAGDVATSSAPRNAAEATAVSSMADAASA